MAKNVLTHNLSEPLNGTKTATVEINTDSGNLTIDQLTGGEQVLASGTLQYFEKQGLPTRTLSSSNGQATRRCDLRHARYIGLARTHLQHILVAVALNLVRWYAFFTERPRMHLKPSKFAALGPVGS